MSFESPNELPYPSPQEVELSTQLINKISDEIEKRGGSISYARYMEMALYEPTLGYYVNGRQKFGEGGDFITAPELTPLFTQSLANQVIEVFENLDEPASMLEFGGGSGALAVEMLDYLDKKGQLPKDYYILDVSPYLQASQRVKLSDRIPHLMDRVHWVSDIPEDFVGVVIANEVLDAMPINRIRFYRDGQHKEIHICLKDDKFYEFEKDIEDENLKKEVATVFQEYGENLTDGYTTEINLYAGGWLQLIHDRLTKGVVILIDYGYPRSEWYIPDRFDGTLSCYYRHRHHDNSLILPGLQDITSHVDFTGIAEKADSVGFTLGGFANQAAFLTGCGLEGLLQNIDTSDTQAFLAITSPIKKLILPHEMGELFKVMALTKGYPNDLMGFRLYEHSARL